MQNKSEHHEERRISYIWGFILAALILLAGIAVYTLMEGQAKTNLSKSLEALLQNKVHLFENNINQGQGIDSTDGISHRYPLIEALEKYNKLSPSKSNQVLQKIAESFINKKFLAVSIYNAKGEELAMAGQFSEKPELRVALAEKKSSFLLWDEQFILNSSNDVYSYDQYLGKVVTEKRMPQLTLAFTDVASIGKTGEFAICKSLADKNDMQCFLNGFAGKKFFLHQKRVIKGKSLPMNYALNGKEGLIFAKDYRKENVVAAYSPVGSLGLGMVLKIDQDELYHPISDKLNFIIPALIALVISGILLMRWLVTPLVRNLISSEKETKSANIELQRSRKRYRLVLDNSPYCIHEIDQNGRYKSMNPTGLKMLSIQSESDIKNTFYMDGVSDEDKAGVAQLMEKGLQGQQSDFEFKGANGKNYQSSFVPIQDEESGVLRLMGWTQDITERRQNEEKLRLSQKMDALGKLTGGIAHDYNNMLGIVLGFSELLKEHLVNEPELKEYVDQIYRAGERGTKLTKKLLSFSRHQPTDAESININTLLLDHKNMLEKTLTVRIKLIFDLAEDLWSVKLDSASLEDVILNLSINAMHAMEQGGELTFLTHNEHFNATDAAKHGIEAGDYVLLSLTDTGIGMDEGTQNRMFEPFYSTKGDKGTGLGLSQVYGFVQSHDGHINVYSEHAKGTCISLYFPRNNEVETTYISSAENEGNKLSGNEIILIVDDEPALLTMTSAILSSHGYQVLTANDGEQALAVLEKEQVDLLLSDIIMPNMDGNQLAARVIKLYPHIKIQLVSGYSDNDGKVDDTLHERIIRKPFFSRVLLRRIRTLLDD
ncbi:MAG: hypothetical protein BMS9Abin31_0001 [Gammaproteobacteria bacterium]|nr:MAG: hypothetical protein BMS9Abin31_0001 [Gammaproteobacteria bacterium]